MKCGKIGSTIPTRFIIGGMIGLACIIFQIIRSNMSILILAMTKNPYNSSIELPDYGPRYEWSTYDQSFILGSYFWGNTLVVVFAGVFAERYGARNIMGYSFAIAAILSAVSPVGAQFLWLSILLRFLTGVVMGTVSPSFQALIATWAPPEEKGKFLSLLTFTAFGSVIDWSMSGYIIEQYGWNYAFYVVAVILGIFAVIWFFVVYDSPSTHPRITEKEREFILSKLNKTGANNSKKAWPPFRSIVTSVPFWALLFFHMGNLYGYYFLLTSVPRYLSEVHSFSLSSTGLLSSLPYLTRVPAGIVFGLIGDLLANRKTLNKNTIRKSFSICSHFIPGCFLRGITFVGDQPYTCVPFITVALCFNSAMVITSLHNPHDLSPNFASTIYGLTSLAATTAGYLAPLVVAHFTRERSTAEEWQNVFFVGAGILMGTTIIFILFGSGHVQKWNNILDEGAPIEDSNTELENKELEKNH